MKRVAAMFACFAVALAVIFMPQIPSGPVVLDLGATGIFNAKEGLAIGMLLIIGSRFCR